MVLYITPWGSILEDLPCVSVFAWLGSAFQHVDIKVGTWKGPIGNVLLYMHFNQAAINLQYVHQNPDWSLECTLNLFP